MMATRTLSIQYASLAMSCVKPCRLSRTRDAGETCVQAALHRTSWSRSVCRSELDRALFFHGRAVHRHTTGSEFPKMKCQERRTTRMKQVLITGGAGFIGSHLADELLANGYRVRVLDTLDAQVHGESRRRPDYLDERVELVVGDVCDKEAVQKALQGVDAVYHFASAVGVGQSMYEIAHYTRVNNLGTAVLLDALVAKPVERLLLATSMRQYGEGLYRHGQAE